LSPQWEKKIGLSHILCNTEKSNLRHRFVWMRGFAKADAHLISREGVSQYTMLDMNPIVIVTL
jgi:hypothetical protein